MLGPLNGNQNKYSKDKTCSANRAKAHPTHTYRVRGMLAEGSRNEGMFRNVNQNKKRKIGVTFYKLYIEYLTIPLYTQDSGKRGNVSR